MPRTSVSCGNAYPLKAATTKWAVGILLIVASACRVGATPPLPAEEEMLDTWLHAIAASDAVVVAAVQRAEGVSHDGALWRRSVAAVSEGLKGPIANGSVVIDIEVQGKETPELPIGREFVFFLRRREARSPEDALQIVDLTRPQAVPVDARGRYLALARAYAKLASAEAEPAPVRAHVLRVLRSEFPSLRADAARTAGDVSGWTADELAEIAALLAVDAPEHQLNGSTREFLVAAVATHGD